MDAYFDQSWYRVRQLRLQLRSHARIHRQVYRDQAWFVVQDPQTGQFHRLSPSAHLFVSLLDGCRSVEQAWQETGRRLGNDQPGQAEVIRLLSQLHRADLLIGDRLPDLEETGRRSRKLRRSRLSQRVRNPLAVRLPLLDPDRFLHRTGPLVRWVFGPLGIVLWFGLVMTAAVLALLNWSELTHNVVDRVLSAGNILLMILAYLLVKALHELGHGYAVRYWNGEVHEIGLMFLVFMPVPYVDASASSAFRSKWQRAAVASAGIIVELFLAALATIVWTLLEPGLLRAFAFNVMAIAGISTFLFNGNPLLRFDGYYVLSDLIEIPNLGKRANDYFTYLLKTRLLGVANLRSPVQAPGEAGWLLGYSIASFCYRLFLMAWIAWFLLTKIPVAGILLAAYMLFNSLLLPLARGLKFLLFNPALQGRRRGSLLVAGSLSTALVLLLTAVPLPYATLVEGVVWVPEEASLRTEADGTVSELLAAPNSLVSAGTPLIRLEDPLLETDIRILQAERRELDSRLLAARQNDQVQVRMIQEQLKRTEAALELLQERAEHLTLVARSDGIFTVRAPEDLPGRFFPRGTPIAHVIGERQTLIQTLIDQSDIELVRERTDRVDVRFVQRVETSVPASISRDTPAAIDNVPRQALALVDGGDIALDPEDPERKRLLERMFRLELLVPQPPPDGVIGGRVHIRFDHGTQPLLPRLVRLLRQLFLAQLNA
ncbi:MAG: peptidase M50 [Oceanospirillaceae bacterium]|nr:peptidase M50 [Oceanospirillaceae bacterium]